MRSGRRRLPSDASNLQHRRAANDVLQCTAADRARTPQYDSLQALDAYFNTELVPVLQEPLRDACALVPLECSFLDTRAHFYAGVLPRPEAELFLKQCSYLSDDLLGDIFLDDREPSIRVPASIIDAVLSCPDADDYRTIITTTLAKMPCERIPWDQRAYRNAEVQRKAGACREH